MLNIIECKHLCHAYGDRVIYQDLNFTIPQGKIMGLLGKNGTGKTTTINILTGYLKPLSGSCTIFGEDCNALSPFTKQRIGLLLEGHVQYPFMRPDQLETFYRSFYPRWNSEIFHDLISKLKVSPKQKIGSMSNGQRSQVALGIVLAQDPDLLILDDFSLGLDPGYRRLFTDILKEYVRQDQKTVFLTSHIIQDMERLIDDCIIMGYGEIIVQDEIRNLMQRFNKYSFRWLSEQLPSHPSICHCERLWNGNTEAYSFLNPDEFAQLLSGLSGTDVECERENGLSLEDVFIGLTGKY